MLTPENMDTSKIQEPEDLFHKSTILDMIRVQSLGRGCGMKVAKSEFEERDGMLRLSRVVLVHWDFSKFQSSTPAEWKVIID